MRKKSVLSLLLAILLSLSMTLTAFADQPAGSAEETEVVTGETQDTNEDDIESVPKSTQEEITEDAESFQEPQEYEAESGDRVQAESKAEAVVLNAAEWTVDDFTYTTMEQTLNGCDYTRQFTIKGSAISGFSETGEEKVKINKALILPAVDDQGQALVGVADKAFADQGLTSVVFPPGMLVEYDDTVTNSITRRGNFIIGMGAFEKNNLTSLYLPDGVIAVMSSAFRYNQLESVNIPRTIWWIENMSFANNQLSKVNFPKTCDFQLEIHGMAFAQNNIKSVRLPDYTAVVNKYSFNYNPGMEPCPDYAPDKEKALGGVVYMYTDNAGLEFLDRIHHIDRLTESQKSWHQKLVVTDIHEIEGEWSIQDFTIEGTVITGLSESGAAKRAGNKHLILPDRNAAGAFITELADTTAPYGLFGAEGEGFDTVELPNRVKKIGNRAFVKNGLIEAAFPPGIQEIGMAAFQENNLISVILPDSIISLGGGAFASNTTIERVSISRGLTEIPAGAFGCSTGSTWMEKFTAVTIPEGIISIGNNAFAGNNFSEIIIPSTVESIGNYAFSTKNYLNTDCTLSLPEGLISIGKHAFRNKVIEVVELPSSVTGLPNSAFTKEYSDNTEAVITKVIVSNPQQYYDKVNFPGSQYHKLYLNAENTWTAEDFIYEEITVTLYPASDPTDEMDIIGLAVAGFSEQGEVKNIVNKDLVIPETDPEGRAVTGVAAGAFKNKGLETVTFPENVKTEYNGSWNSEIDERGNFAIQAEAFMKNNLKTAVLPEGVIYVGDNAFDSNQLVMVKLPQTLMSIATHAFAQNAITTVDFAQTSDFSLSIETMAFGVNKIEAVQLPDKVEKIDKWAFLQNTGKEAVSESGSAEEKRGGVVYLYTVNPAAESEDQIEHIDNGKSKVQKLIIDTIPAEDAPWNTADFTFTEDETVVTGLSDKGKAKIKVNGNVIIPSIGPSGKDILGIGDGVNGTGTLGYKEDSTLYAPTALVLPVKLETIGKFAFSGNGFTAINLPQTLQKIDNSAFQGSGLISVVLPESISTLGVGVFANSNDLENAVLSGSLKDIPQGTFSMTNLKQVVIPEGVETIGRTAFSGAHTEVLVLPSTLTTIERQAFMNHQLTKLEIPAGVESIEQSAFTVTQAGLSASLTELILHEGLISIGKEAFRNCGLTETEIPSTLSSLPADAFAKSSQKVVLRTSNPEQLVETDSFKPASDSHEVVYDVLAGSGWSYEDFSFDGVTITGWSNTGNEKRMVLKNLVLPDETKDGEEITEIAEGAFKIPNEEVEQLKDSVDSPNGMLSVHLPKHIETIGKQAFEYNNLTMIELGENITKIDECAFKGNKLEKVVLPDSVTELGSGAFTMNNITDLTLSKGVTVIPQAAFSMNIGLMKVDIPDTVTEIGEMAFAGARLRTLDIPESVVKIGRKAFHLHHLSELTIPGNVKEIGESAFEGTFKAQTLTTLTLEEGIEKIGKYAFKEGLLKEVKLPASLIEMGEEPFYNNVGIDGNQKVICNTDEAAHLLMLDSATHEINYQGTWVTKCFGYEGQKVLGFSDIGKIYVTKNSELLIPSTNFPAKMKGINFITSVGENAFKGNGITKATLPQNLESIEDYAFAENQLTEVQLPESVSAIGTNAFADNGALVKLYTKNKATADKYPEGTLNGAVVLYSGSQSGNNGNNGGSGGNNSNPTDNMAGGNLKGSQTAAYGAKGSVRTGDLSTELPYLALGLMSLSVMIILSRKRYCRKIG